MPTQWVSEAEYQSHLPWCLARRFGRLVVMACNCDLRTVTANVIEGEEFDTGTDPGDETQPGRLQ